MAREDQKIPLRRLGNEVLFPMALAELLPTDPAHEVLAERGNVIENGQLVKTRRAVVRQADGSSKMSTVRVANGKVTHIDGVSRSA